ncbi:phosphoribosyl-AMP cyclohydrolase [Gilvimarinus polysaccharolyticus]|uniref:phosphoribosyl-AMP cyclohydrolase n=1 Tax=Gilvimarinus polysaccharolyticus TaxID=863921 RepID=UPI000673504D|nr:phosphoribosyl-AMP cyclohydrolase [Gilvimarinus polysaccharolyticus]
MKREFFIGLEGHSQNTPLPLPELISQLAFNRDGLIPVITQDVHSGTILMFAWMNKDALEQTLATRCVTYWSRSRQQLWIKGETSGHTQRLISMSFDCDGDAVLCKIEQEGAACHTGRASCFYLEVEQQTQKVWVTGGAGRSCEKH